MNIVEKDRRIKERLGFDCENTEYDDEIDWNNINKIVTKDGWIGLLLHACRVLNTDGSWISEGFENFLENSLIRCAIPNDYFGVCESFPGVMYEAYIALSMLHNKDSPNVEHMLKYITDPKKIPIEYHVQARSFAFIWGCITNDLILVARLLKEKQINLMFLYNTGFVEACSRGHADIVKLLLVDERIDPNMSFDDHGIVQACRNGHVGVVKLLFADERVNEKIDTYMILTASVGHYKPGVLNLLLDDRRFVEQINNDSSLRHDLLYFGIGEEIECITVMNMLLYDSRINIDPSGSLARLLEFAAELETETIRTNLISLLLKHPKANSILTHEQKNLYNSMLGG